MLIVKMNIEDNIKMKLMKISKKKQQNYLLTNKQVLQEIINLYKYLKHLLIKYF